MEEIKLAEPAGNKKFRLIVKTQQSSSTFCPFLDKLCILDEIAAQIIWSSKPYSLDDRDGGLYQAHAIEKQKMLKWLAENHPGQILH